MTKDAASPDKTIAFQGEPGANSHIACREAFPDMTDLPCDTFEDVFAAVNEGRARLAMIAIENSLAGRVADVHHLIPGAGLYIVGEHFLPVRHQLLGLKGSRIEDIRTVHSHVHALGQCRRAIRELGLKAVVAADTAGAARQVVEAADKTRAAIASNLAADIYGLDVLRADIEDETHNTTRFLVMAKEPNDAEPEEEPVVTSFIFRVRNVPAALYKALGGFATNGVNMTKLESYQLEGTFNASQFYADIEGHPASRNVRLALEELEFFTSELRILGVYKAHPYRAALAAGNS
ncbi:prephenate dehydratase [Parvibaculum sp.]|jgi:prephenate dehydratase|uniref:prephenate dehydratase n=1 Tax=Parvibaculum sp. TaxID=2024848 RepID=UPI002FDA7204